jgi:hypothetical protein
MRVLPALICLGLPGLAGALEAPQPAAPPPAALREPALSAIRSALAAGQPATARAHAARLLWQLEPTPEEARAARLAVIDSHLAEKQGETAFRAMLRFGQDYRPLERATAEHFVGGLLELGLAREAVNWLAALDDSSALKLRLRLQAGLVRPEVAIAQARARAPKGGAPWWRVLAEAAGKTGDGTLAVEAQEQLINAGEPEAALWDAYDREARAAAGQHSLLTGDDAAWLQLARRPGIRAARARALLDYLSRHGAGRETRLRAQVQHLHSLQQAGLERAALQVYERNLNNAGASSPRDAERPRKPGA